MYEFEKGNRFISFRYEHLDRNNNVLRPLNNVLTASVSMSAFAIIKRTARFTIMDDGNIDYLNDRIKPYLRIFRPSKAKTTSGVAFVLPAQPTVYKEVDSAEIDGVWEEYPLGVFSLSSPTRFDALTNARRDIEAYDLTIILKEDKLVDRLTITEGQDYYEVITGLIKDSGVTDYNIVLSDKKVPRTTDYDRGTSYLTVINDLLGQIGYTPLHADADGVFVSEPYRTPKERSPNHTYKADDSSVIHIGVSEELDMVEAPNVFTVVRTNADEEPLVSTFVNSDPNNPLSVPSRGRRIVDYREVSDISDQEALDRYTLRIANEANMKYGRIKFTTALMPNHGYSDIVQLVYPNLGIDGDFLEISWDMTLEVGGKMSHELRYIVDYGYKEETND